MSQDKMREALRAEIEAEGIERVVYAKGLREMREINAILIAALSEPPEPADDGDALCNWITPTEVRRLLTLNGIAAPESMEELGFKMPEYVARLAKLAEPADRERIIEGVVTFDEWWGETCRRYYKSEPPPKKGIFIDMARDAWEAGQRALKTIPSQTTQREPE